MPAEQNKTDAQMISIVVPLYNEEAHIYRSIKSILDQTVTNFEVIIVDDGSTDKSVEVISGIDDSRVRIIQQDNAGVSAARNRGIKEANYRYIAFLDADDEWLPVHLETMLQLVSKYPECGVYATNYKKVDASGNESLPVNTSLILPNSAQDAIFSGYFDVASKTAPPISASSVLIRKEALQDIGGFPLGVSAGEDLLVWAKLACAYDIAYSRKATVHYHFLSYAEWVLYARKQDPNDYVGKSLKELRRNCKNQPRGLDGYILLWYRMRLINYMKLGDTTNAYTTLNSIREYKNISFSNYCIFFVTFFPSFLRKYMLSKWAAYNKRMSE